MQVLAEAGPDGMRVEEIAREIQLRGFRDLRTSKTPEASGVYHAWLVKCYMCRS